MILTDVSLREYNTLKLEVLARFFCVLNNQEQLHNALAFANNRSLPTLVLGQGSNVVLTGDFEGLVLCMRNSTYQVKPLSDKDCEIIVTAGYSWDDFVMKMIASGFYGLENLTAIPGCVGAAPIQNIGAYGVEVGEFINWVEGFDLVTYKPFCLSRDECEFGYRDSIFKGRYKNKKIITQVSFKLQKNFKPIATYPGIKDWIKNSDCSAKSLSDAIRDLRRKKLPDPCELGNAGSFFKNPTVSQAVYKKLLDKFADLVAYPLAGNQFKLAAGWLIEQCGANQLYCNEAYVHKKQALVLVNRGGAAGSDILNLASQIQGKVKAVFGVDLEIEPQIY